MFPRGFENPWTPNPYGVRRFTRALNTPLKIEDSGTELNYNGSTNLTVKLPSNFELQHGWNVLIRNSGTNVITFNPNNISETVGGATTWVCNPGDLALLTRGPTGLELDRLAGMNKLIISASGSGNVTVPAGVYTMFGKFWGAGGGCDNFGGAAHVAGGGGWCEATLSVVPGATCAYVVGAAGNTAGTDGGNTTFTVSAGTLTASGGGGSVGGTLVGAAGGSGSGDNNATARPGIAGFAVGGFPWYPGGSSGIGGGATAGASAVGADGRIELRWA